jgi:hypothetical protein
VSDALFILIMHYSMCYYTTAHPMQVMENSNINADPRNQAVSAAADGVPFFKDRNAANGWPVVLFPESAPEGVSGSNPHAHMVGLVPSEYLSEDEEGKRVLVKK